VCTVIVLFPYLAILTFAYVFNDNNLTAWPLKMGPINVPKSR